MRVLCAGDAVADECGECNGNGSSCATSEVDILYSSDADIAGFQFNVNGVTVEGAAGGAAAGNGFSVTGTSTVLGFSFTGAVIPAGSGVLTTLTVTGDVADMCLSDLVLSASGGTTLDSEVVDCLTAFIQCQLFLVVQISLHVTMIQMRQKMMVHVSMLQKILIVLVIVLQK